MGKSKGETKKAATKGPSLAGLFMLRKRIAGLDAELISAKEGVKKLKADRGEAVADLFRVLDDMRTGQKALLPTG